MKKAILFLISIIFISSVSVNVNAATILPVNVLDSSIEEIQEYIDLGYLTYEDLVRIYLERIEAYDKEYNTIITINENAIEEAKEKDRIRKNGGIKSLLFGMPILVKDNIDVVGMPTTAGTKSLSMSYPTVDATVIQKLKDAGAIILGKTNMSELAFMASSSTSSYGTVKNSFNTLYSSYGSSGGSAVAVSLSFAVAALGTDTNASVRAPASINNVVGIRPSTGLVSRYGVLPYDVTKDAVGVITKHVKDSSLILDVISGYDENDYLSVDIDISYLLDENFTLEGINIGIISSFLEDSSDNIKLLMKNAISTLKEQGANIIYLDNFYTKKMESIMLSSFAGFTMCNGFNKYIINKTGTIKSFYDLVNSKGHIYNLSNYSNHCNRDANLNIYKNYKEEFQGIINSKLSENNIDILVYPSSSVDAIKISDLNKGLYSSYLHYISPVAGYPDITVPLGFGTDGIPYGIDFISTLYDESRLYKVANIYQSFNNTITTPTKAPNLYGISKNVDSLKKIYEKLINDNDNYYNNFILEVKEYFSTYSTNENIDIDASNLLTDYSNILRDYKKSTNINNLYNIILFVLSLLFIVLILLLMKRKRK